MTTPGVPHQNSGDGVQSFDVDGVKVLLRPASAHEVVAVRLYVRGGVTHLDLARAGAEAMYARVSRRGTERFSKRELNAALARHGIDLGTAAGHDYTIYNLRCLKRFFDIAWDLFVQVILHPTLEREEMEIVRQQMLLDLRQAQDSPDGALVDLARAHCYAGHPYAPNPLGTLESIAGLDEETLRAHMRRALVRSNLVLAAAGDLTAADLSARVHAAFASLPAGEGPPPLAPPLAYAAGNSHVEARDTPTNYILGQFVAPPSRHDDYHAALVACSILRDRFFEEVRTKRNLSYAPSASLGNDAANLGSIYVTAVDPRATLAVMRDEMRRLANDALDRRELGDKIRVFLTRYHMQNETHHAQAGFLASHEILAGGWKRSLEFVPRLESISPDDVQRVAGQCLRRIQYFYVGDPAGAAPEIFVDP